MYSGRKELPDGERCRSAKRLEEKGRGAGTPIAIAHNGKDTDTMLNEQNQETGRDSGRRLTAAVLVLAAVFAIGNIYSIWRAHQLHEEIQRISATTAGALSNLRQAAFAHAEDEARVIAELREDLQTTRHQAATTVGEARREALQKTDRVAKELARSIEASHRKQQEEVASQIDGVKQATDQKVDHVMTEVRSVSTEVDKTKSDLQKTSADLKSVIGDLGVQSGLIATNAKELAALRTLGERNYFEFDLKKMRTPTRVGDIQVWLKSADAKRSKYSLMVLADDKRIEKKDKTLNEPVQFYASRMRQPYEIVVNQVSKDRVVGYLATPKMLQSRK
jgi:hypothetical protein